MTICLSVVLRLDKAFGLEVVDLAKDPLAAGRLARSTTRNSKLEKARVAFFMSSRTTAVTRRLEHHEGTAC